MYFKLPRLYGWIQTDKICQVLGSLTVHSGGTEALQPAVLYRFLSRAGRAIQVSEQSWLYHIDFQAGLAVSDHLGASHLCIYPGGCDLNESRQCQKWSSGISGSCLCAFSPLDCIYTFLVQGRHFVLYGVTRRNQYCCNLPPQTWAGVSLMNQTWKQNYAMQHLTALRITQCKKPCCNSIKY